MATGKGEKKSVEKKATARKNAAQAKAVAETADKKPKAVPSRPLPEKRPKSVNPAVGPTARMCPLVLDGELDAGEFSPGDCLTCSEFDCRFCEADGAGSVRGSLFAAGEDSDDGDDGFGGDIDFEGGEELGEDEVGDEEDLF